MQPSLANVTWDSVVMSLSTDNSAWNCAKVIRVLHQVLLWPLLRCKTNVSCRSILCDVWWACSAVFDRYWSQRVCCKEAKKFWLHKRCSEVFKRMIPTSKRKYLLKNCMEMSKTKLCHTSEMVTFECLFLSSAFFFSSEKRMILLPTNKNCH